MSRFERALIGIVLAVAILASIVIIRWGRTSVGPSAPVRMETVPARAPWVA